ncbi:MAG TPA: FAD-dependent oxidoreductase [Rhodanobacteraceae bacterium]
MAAFDLIIVGAGIVGCACADAVSAAGWRTAVIEPGPVGGGATAAAMGHLVAMDDDAAELALTHDSIRRWQAFAALPAAEFSRCGTLWVARNEAEANAIDTRIARLAAVGIRAQVLDAKALYQHEPALAPGLLAGMLVADEAVVYPPAMARHLLQQAGARGAALHLGRRVQALTSGGAMLDDHSHLDGPVLLATGGALPELAPQLPMRLRKGHLVITDRYPGALRHQVLELGYADSAHGHAASSVAFNVQPRPTGQVLIGSSREFDVTDTAVSPPMLQRMLQHAFTFMPMLRQLHAIRAWTGLRPATPDGLPYLGAVPGMDDVWVAAGHEGLGVTTALGSAQLIVDLLRGHTPAIDPAPYAPARVLT